MTVQMNGMVAQRVHGLETPHLPLTLDAGDEWFRKLEPIKYRRSECHASYCPPLTFVWQAEISYTDGEGARRPIAAWALTPYLAYARLREKLHTHTRRMP